jgi:hypothetical protein
MLASRFWRAKSQTNLLPSLLRYETMSPRLRALRVATRFDTPWPLSNDMVGSTTMKTRGISTFDLTDQLRDLRMNPPLSMNDQNRIGF